MKIPPITSRSTYKPADVSFNVDDLRSRGAQRVASELRKSQGAKRTAGDILLESNQTRLFSARGDDTFDIFLSHTFADSEIVLGLVEKLEGHGYSVYVDWIQDKHLDRTVVTRRSVQTLKTRMKQSKCLLFATTESYSDSRWMPWELGFMDGHCGQAAILPLFRDAGSASHSYSGQEYLGAYPYCIEAPAERSRIPKLWICATSRRYVRFDLWLTGSKPQLHST